MLSIKLPNNYIMRNIASRNWKKQIGKLASSVNLYRFTHFLDFPFGAIFGNLLVGATSPIPFEHHLPMMAARFSIVFKRTVE